MTVDLSSRLDPLSALERRICDRIAAREDELVQLLRTLIAFDTRVPSPAPPPATSTRCRPLARRLQAGARTSNSPNPIRSSSPATG